MKVVAIIPARYNSSRFPGKPLELINDKPMIAWVYGQVKDVRGIDEVYVATDDERIKNVCDNFNINVVMTSDKHLTSTNRVYEVSKQIDSDLYVVINGDEPLIDPNTIERIIPKEKIDLNRIYVANLMTKIKDPVEVVDFTNIKVVTDKNNNAMFFSRSPIPYPKNSMEYSYFKHVGVLIYNKLALKFFDETKKGYYESIEDVNEIRFIENGIDIKMIEVDSKNLSVDTKKDLEKVKLIVKEGNIKMQNIKLIVFDVDGTLTDGKIYMGNNGELFKCFDAHDAVGVRKLKKYNITSAIITGRTSDIVINRANEMNIDLIYQNIQEKKEKLDEIVKKLNISYNDVLYIGDDENDLECMKTCGFVACPNNAIKKVKEIANYISPNNGGDGAVRDIIDNILGVD